MSAVRSLSDAVTAAHAVVEQSNGRALALSLDTAAAIDVLVERLRTQARESAQAFDLERARNKRLYAENVELGAQVRRLEGEKRRLEEQISNALLPRSM